MESTGIYHIPLYYHLGTGGFPLRIIHGLEVRGVNKSRVRKTTSDTIDADSIARLLVIRKEKETSTIPENLMNISDYLYPSVESYIKINAKQYTITTYTIINIENICSIQYNGKFANTMN